MVILLHCAAKKKNAEAVEAAAAFERDKRQRCTSLKQHIDPGYQPKGRKPPPIVLSQQRYGRLYAGATGTDLTRAAIEHEEEEKFDIEMDDDLKHATCDNGRKK